MATHIPNPWQCERTSGWEFDKSGKSLVLRNMRNRHPEHLPGRGYLAYFPRSFSAPKDTFSFISWSHSQSQ
jgi:hypothetical protein